MRFRIVLAILLVVCCGASNLFAATDPLPVVTFVETSKDVLIGDTITFCVTFQNQGGSPGFAPYIDLVLPSRGFSGPTPCDGVKFVSAEMVDVNPSPVPLPPAAPTPSLPCGTTNPIPHPFTPEGANGVTLPNTGDQLITIPLPFGSFDPSQPAVRVRVTAKVDPGANDGQPLTAYARGGFRFGKTPINDLLNDNNLLNSSSPIAANWPVTMTIRPHVFMLTKRYLGLEDEIVAGPSFAEKFEIKPQVAPSQTINNLTLHDCATLGTVFGPINAPGGTVTPIGQNCFDVNYLTATSAIQPITATFYAGPPLAPTPPLACSKTLLNRVNVLQGTWTPADTRDPVVTINASASAKIQVKAIAIRKTVTPLSALGPIPGTQLRYHLDFAISDYLSFGKIAIDDTFSDGQQYVPLSAQLIVNDKNGSLTRNEPQFPPGTVTSFKNVTETYRCPPVPSAACGTPGMATNTTLGFSTRMHFDVSKVMLNSNGLPPFNAGVLTGALVGANAIPATGSLEFLVGIPQTFTYNHPPALDDHYVDKDDPLLNAARITAQTPAGAKCGDDTFTCISVPRDVLSKRVVARNNIPITASPLSSPPFQHGDAITFQLKKVIPSGDAQAMTIQDWFPLPAIQVTSMAFGPCAPFPAANTACYSFSTTPVFGAPPTVTPDTTTNSIKFTFGDFHGTAAPLTLTIYVTLTIDNAAMADQLLLTNEAEECETNSYSPTKICQDAIAMFQVQEPSLRIYKWPLCPNNPCPEINPLTRDAAKQVNPGTPAPPAAICTSSAPCPRFTGVINSTNLPGFIGSSTTLGDAGDVVPFIVVVENAGHSPDGAHDITIDDVLPAGLTFVPGTLCVTLGDGTPLAAGSSFPLTFPDSGTAGALGPYSATSGANIAVMTFDVKVGSPSQVEIGSCLVNHAEIKAYSNSEGGPNFVPAGFTPPFFADASICVKPKEVVKQVLTTSEPHTPMGPPPKLAIGEIIYYQLLVQIPEGHATNFTVSDPLVADLQFLAPPTITTIGVNTSLTFGPPTWTSNVDFNLGTVANNDNDAECEYLVIVFRAQVLNTAANNDTNSKPNAFTVRADVAGVPTTIGTSNSVNAVIVEPYLTILKTVTMHGSSTPLYTVTVQNNSSTTAFDVVISDVAGPCLQNPTMTGASSSGGASPPLGSSPVTVKKIPPGGSVVIHYQSSVLCQKCSDLVNTATVTWTSLPGPHGTSNATAGNSGTTNGERDGSNGTGGVNDYVASFTVGLCGKVCGAKFNDQNANQTHDTGEPYLSGWTINASQNGANAGSAVTAANGAYCIELLPGAYQICETQQSGWQQTSPNPACTSVGVTPGASVTGIDFGNRECWARVCGTKTEYKPGGIGPPLAGWTIYAIPVHGGPAIVAVTDSNGNWCLDLPGPGSYTITEVPQNGWTMVVPKPNYTVTVECAPSPTGTPGTAIVVGGGNPNSLPFINANPCANKQCPAPQQCIAPNGQAVCATPPAPSPCSTIHCGWGMHCAVINGNPVCVP